MLFLVNISLDTHIALWSLVDSPKLSEGSRQLILDGGNSIFISTVVLWEIAIKYQLNRGATGDMPIDATKACDLFLQAGYLQAPITWSDAVQAFMLPRLHQDPFDRMLVAQTVGGDLWLLSNDRIVQSYGGRILTN